MANSSGWGDGAANNNVGWGQGANNAIGWGSSHATSWAGATDIVGTTSLLLDTYSSAAAAYSLRKLRTAYTGSAIRVRRSSDNTEQNIGFSGVNLDTAALTTFCGAGNGFVTTWYDQSGNANNCVQSTAANQAQIVTSGSIVTQNGKPSLLFNGTTQNFLSTAAIDPLFITAVNTPNLTGVFTTIMGADSSTAGFSGAIYFQYSTPTRTAQFGRKTITDTNTPTFFAKSSIQEVNNVTNLMTGTRTSTSIAIYTNNVVRGTGTTAAPSLAGLGGTDAGKFRLMAGYFTNNVVDYMTGNLTEFIAYTSDQSANRTGINTNINTYYGIY